MVAYKDQLDTVAHNFANSTLTIDGEFTVDGLEEWAVELDEDEVTTQSVADGTAVFNESPVLTGTITFSSLEAPASTDKLWAKLEAGEPVKVAFVDSACPNLNAGAKRARFMKRPVVRRGKEADVVEWTLVATYIKSKSGSYKVEAE